MFYGTGAGVAVAHVECKIGIKGSVVSAIDLALSHIPLPYSRTLSLSSSHYFLTPYRKKKDMRLFSITAALAAVASLSLLSTPTQADLAKVVRVNPSTQQFIDAQGRTRFFHGTNMVKKSFPWHLDVDNFVPSWSIVDKDIELLKALNINIVRLGK